MIQQTKDWIKNIVIGLNLCPFAKSPFVTNKIRYSVSEATSEAELLQDFLAELNTLLQQPKIETTLLIHPNILGDFLDYNDFLYLANDVLAQAELEGVIQIASFHPDYYFAGTQPNDRENYTNRSPYPMLHLLRESSVEMATTTYPNIDDIPYKNIEMMQQLSEEKFKVLFRS